MQDAAFYTVKSGISQTENAFMNAYDCPVKYDNEFLRQGICPFKSLANAMSVVFLSEAKNSLDTSNSY